MQAIIFDFGNVIGLFDHAMTLRRLEPFTDMPAEEILGTIYQGKLEDDFESGRIGMEEFLDIFRSRCRLCCDRAFLAQAMANIFEPNPEICGLLPKLQSQYRLLLGSNTNIVHSRHFRKQFEAILRPFQAVVLSHEIGVRKPLAGFFEHCQKLAGCPACDCLFIDDLPANVEGAKAIGMRGIVYAPGTGFEQNLRHMTND